MKNKIFVKVLNANKELSHWKFFKNDLSIDGKIIELKNQTVPLACNKCEIQKSKFLANNPNTIYC